TPLFAASFVGDLDRINLFAAGRVPIEIFLPLFLRNPPGQAARKSSTWPGIEHSAQRYRDLAGSGRTGNSIHPHLSTCERLARVASASSALRICRNNFRGADKGDTVLGDLIFVRLRFIFPARGFGPRLLRA